MEKTPEGTSVGVDDPYDYVERCDHVTDDGRCRYAIEHADPDSEFARALREDGYACPVVSGESEARSASGVASSAERRPAGSHAAEPRDDGESDDPRAGPDWEWADCPHFRCRNRARECVRCGLEEVRMGHSAERPLLEEHHLSYRVGEVRRAPGHANGEGTDPRAGEGDELTHEITVYLCRWCHAKVHDSWARVDDDAAPDTEAIAAREERRSREAEELGFESAADRYDG